MTEKEHTNLGATLACLGLAEPTTGYEQQDIVAIVKLGELVANGVWHNVRFVQDCKGYRIELILFLERSAKIYADWQVHAFPRQSMAPC